MPLRVGKVREKVNMQRGLTEMRFRVLLLLFILISHSSSQRRPGLPDVPFIKLQLLFCSVAFSNEMVRTICLWGVDNFPCHCPFGVVVAFPTPHRRPYQLRKERGIITKAHPSHVKTHKDVMK